jgi:hypothetical protein
MHLGVTLSSLTALSLPIPTQHCRHLDGVVYYVNQHLVENVPSVSEATVARQETGESEIKLVVANLKSGSYYPAYLHGLPCIAALGSSPRYMRDVACVGNEGGFGCELVDGNDVRMHGIRLADQQCCRSVETVQANGSLTCAALRLEASCTTTVLYNIVWNLMPVSSR